MQLEKAKKQKLASVLGILFLAITFVAIYLGNRAVPFVLMGDDKWYATKLFSEEPIRNLADIFAAQKWHFMNWGGRSIAHGILQAVILTGWNAADWINMVFSVLLALMIYKVSGADKPVYIAFIWGMLFGLNANWIQTLCWHPGAANYLYMTTFILAFLWCYVRALEGESKALPGIAIWILPLGLIAGWSNENMGPTVWLLSLGIMVYLWFKERRFYVWMLLGNITCLVGSLLVILAPGNFVRTEQTISDKGLLWRTFLRCFSEGKALLDYLSPALLVTAFAICVAVGIMGIKLSKANIVYLLGALLSWGAMVLSPHYPDRATFGTMVFLICVIVSLAKACIKQKPNCKPWLMLVGGVIWLRGMFLIMEYTCTMWGWIK